MSPGKSHLLACIRVLEVTPPLNDTVSYLIALGGSPPGYFGSVMLTIEGITDASQNNTKVDVTDKIERPFR